MELEFRDYMLITGLIWLGIWGLFLVFVYDFSRGSFVWLIPGVILVLAGLLNWRLGEDLERKQTTPLENEGRYGPHEGW